MYELDEKSVGFVLESAKLSLENAENHFEAGEILGGKEKFGLAVSHVILAAKECSKSMLLLAKYYKGDMEESAIPFDKAKVKKAYEDFDFDTLFYSHGPKQNVARLVSIFSQIFAKLSPGPMSIFDKVVFKGEELSESDIEKVVETKEKQIRRIEDWERSSIVPDLGLKEHSDWWAQVNDIKNNGLYVGISDNGEWKSSEDFTKQDYKIAHNNVAGMITLMKRILELQAAIDSYDLDHPI